MRTWLSFRFWPFFTFGSGCSVSNRRRRGSNVLIESYPGWLRRSFIFWSHCVVVFLGRWIRSLLNWVSKTRLREFHSLLCLIDCGRTRFLNGVVGLSRIGDLLTGVSLQTVPYKHHWESRLGLLSKGFYSWTIFLWRVGAQINFQPDFFGKYVYLLSVQPFWSSTLKAGLFWHRQFKTEYRGKSHFCGWVYPPKSVNFLCHLCIWRSNSNLESGNSDSNGNHSRWVWPSHLFWCFDG